MSSAIYHDLPPVDDFHGDFTSIKLKKGLAIKDIEILVDVPDK